MKKMAPMAVVAALLASGVPASAEMCTLDVVPAATLLLPYFEVDWTQPSGQGVTTMFWVNNSLPDPALAHVIIWTNWGAAVIDFDVFLTGYDVVVFNLWDLFQGNIPITADEQSDPDDTISPHGLAEWDGSFTGCQNFFPFFVNPVITGTAYDRLTNGCSGLPVTSLGGLCLGEPCAADACGYVTLDNVNQCSLFLDPGEPGYFVDGGTGVARNVNQLWGDYAIIDPLWAYMSFNPLVHIEADDAFNSSSTPTNYTFYGRFTQSAGGSDNREPLGTTWGIRYYDGFLSGTDFVVWRDPTTSEAGESGFTCGVGPDWKPLDETAVTCFDEVETAVDICWGTVPEPTCFPLASQRVRSGSGEMVHPFDFGWCHLNLNIPDDTISGDVDFPASPPGDIAQSWVGAMHSADYVYSGGLQAVELAHGCENLSPTIFYPR
ncbi:MAG: hypothetical protein GY856_25315 [bacterium]|nr:hypothetical protein [bacterium]